MYAAKRAGKDRVVQVAMLSEHAPMLQDLFLVFHVGPVHRRSPHRGSDVPRH